jgi:hypothetical protein
MKIEDDYEKFNKEDINNLNKLNYNFNLNDRFINVTDQDGKHFKCQTPFLKILKPSHVTLNKKKQIANKYLILETNDELDFNNQIGDFMFIINKIHEISQEKIKENSIEWFNTEFDEIGLDIKVKRPIDQQKTSEFIRLSISKDKYIEEEINKLQKDMYVLCNIIFKGLKVSNDYIVEDWELVDIMTQEKFDEIQNTDLLYENNDVIHTLLNDEETPLENVVLKDTPLENIVLKNIPLENIVLNDSPLENLEKVVLNEIPLVEDSFKDASLEEEHLKEKKKKVKIINKKNIKCQPDLIKRINKKIIFT